MTDRAIAPVDAPAAGERPLVVAPNRIDRFYAGGPRIDDLRSAVAPPAPGPEEWVGSTTTSWGEDALGLSRFEDGRLVRDVLAADPESWLGAEHVARWAADPGLLVKLLDAGERLPAHFHPGRPFAQRALGLHFGKTEAWVIVDAPPGSVVHLGLREPVAAERVASWRDRQDVESMLGALHEFPARAGDVFFVPAGTLHAIGAGILMVELQEPTDLSIMLEFERFELTGGSEHLGLGWEQALGALDRGAADPVDLHVRDGAAGGGPGLVELLPVAAAPYFRAQWIVAAGEPVHLAPSFAILVVVDGTPTLWTETGEPMRLLRGHTLVVPWAAGATTIDGDGQVIRCLPPSPGAPEGRW